MLFLAYMVMTAFKVVCKCWVECFGPGSNSCSKYVNFIPNIFYYVIKLIVFERSAIWSLSFIPCLKYKLKP